MLVHLLIFVAVERRPLREGRPRKPRSLAAGCARPAQEKVHPRSTVHGVVFAVLDWPALLILDRWLEAPADDGREAHTVFLTGP